MGKLWQQIRWQKDLLIASLISLILASLASIDWIELTPISPPLMAAIFTVIVGTVGTLFSILLLYSEIISAADNLDYLESLKTIFTYPIFVSCVGFILSILTSTARTQTDIPALPYSPLSNGDLVIIFFLFILLYAILSFLSAFLFVFNTVIEMEKAD